MTQKSTVRELCISALFTAIICVMAQISIPIQPVPFTFSVLAIFLTGAILPPRMAIMSTLAYILLGAVGVPVFAGFKGGLNALVGMTGGYIAAFPIMALVISLACTKFKQSKVIAPAVGMIISLVICYGLGTAWFCYVSGSGFIRGLSLCVIPYIPFDILKLILATGFAYSIKKVFARYKTKLAR